MKEIEDTIRRLLLLPPSVYLILCHHFINHFSQYTVGDVLAQEEVGQLVVRMSCSTWEPVAVDDGSIRVLGIYPPQGSTEGGYKVISL